MRSAVGPACGAVKLSHELTVSGAGSGEVVVAFLELELEVGHLLFEGGDAGLELLVGVVRAADAELAPDLLAQHFAQAFLQPANPAFKEQHHCCCRRDLFSGLTCGTEAHERRRRLQRTGGITAGMVPQLVRIGEEFGIACFSGGGFDGLAGKHDAAVRAVEGGQKSLILHLGDLDPSGEHLFTSLAEDVIAFAAAAGAEVKFERVAVTAEQVVTYNLPTAPPKTTDRRSFSGAATTQAEALPPDILAAIVRQAIEAHRDPQIHRQALIREQAERRAIRERLNR
ncbi:hypothetical protein NE236_34030 [Actinoallomurus purpureus]|uniref:hypothetical protein n=1 Tax=Actinoallomurus purpureus TaxID=478114 RepID=UPI002092ED49|nr:hypothetical protein [Actinoallomurus purpureus]MCO6010001.1 hypothetical protein [Actinoallomurus purpureus]